MFGGAGIIVKYHSGITPTAGFEYMRSPLRHVYVGADAVFENYFFTKNDDEYSRFGGYGYKITQDVSYAYISPKVDIGVGHKEHWHAFFSMGPGFMLSGTQRIAQTTGLSGPSVHPGNQYDNPDISKNLNHTVLRICFGASFHILFGQRKWDLTAGPIACIIPTWLSTNTFGYSGDASMNIKSNYAGLQIGLVHKRHWHIFEPTKSWDGY